MFVAGNEGQGRKGGREGGKCDEYGGEQQERESPQSDNANHNKRRPIFYLLHFLQRATRQLLVGQ